MPSASPLSSLFKAASWLNQHIPHADWMPPPRKSDNTPTQVSSVRAKQTQEDTRQLLIDADRVIAGGKPRYMTPELTRLAKTGISERSWLLLMEAARLEAQSKRVNQRYFPKPSPEVSKLTKALAGP